jgi:hypothetical protein
VLHDFSIIPTAEQYPEASAVWLEREAVVRFCQTPTAPTLSIDHCQAVKLLTEAAVKQHSTVLVPYDRTDTRIEAVQGRTILPDGEIVPLGFEHVSDHPAFGGDKLYSSTRLRIVEFPSARTGTPWPGTSTGSSRARPRPLRR